MTDHDDQLRAALHAEADDVEATPDLLARVRTAATAPVSARRHRRLQLAAAAIAVAALSAGAVVALTEGDDEQRVDVADQDPEPTGCTAIGGGDIGPPTVRDVECAVTTTVPTDDGAIEPADRPTVVALVREDGMLMTVDLATGDRREHLTAGDPRDRPSEGSPSFIDAVDLSPDGEWIYFSTCCEPAIGHTYRIRVDDPDPVIPEAHLSFTIGAYPRVSPDGRFVATSTVGIQVTPIDGGSAAVYETAGTVSSLSWSPDGTQIAFTIFANHIDQPAQVRSLHWDGTTLTPIDPGKPVVLGRFPSWLPNGTLNIVDGAPIADDLDLSQDGSYQWILWVDEAGTIREQAGVMDSERTPVEGLPKAITADW